MEYMFHILRHKWFVALAIFRVGGIPWWRAITHDLSKFSPKEYFTYRRKYVLKNCSREDWKIAWLHHIHRNPHHWEHWMIKGEPLPMPETYVREMVADMMGAGRSYTGSSDIAVWLAENAPNMILHPDTVRRFRNTLEEQSIPVPPALMG